MKGLSLVETIISVSLLFVVLGSVVQIYPASQFALRLSREMGQADALAERTVERVLGGETPVAEVVDLNGTAFTLAISNTDVRPGLAHVVVDVTWQDGRGRPRQVEHEALVTRGWW